jgi:predicted amidohydrolase
VHLHAVQHDIVWENKAATHARVAALLAANPPRAGSLVVLPEMFATGFSMNPAVTDDSTSRETETFLQHLAHRHHAAVLAGLVGRDAAGRPGNQALALAPAGRELARYTKLRPFTPGGETANYAPGERPVVFQWQGWRVAPFICYDLRFPEFIRPVAAAGVDLLVFIASWPDKRIAHWMKLLQARAIENQCYVAGVNRVGTDPSHRYCGRSLIVDYFGEIIADAGEGEGVISATLDRAALDDYRAGLPFLQDIRPEFLGRG